MIGLCLRIWTTNITKQFETNAAQMKEMTAELSARIDDTQSANEAQQEIAWSRRPRETRRRGGTVTRIESSNRSLRSDWYRRNR